MFSGVGLGDRRFRRSRPAHGLRETAWRPPAAWVERTRKVRRSMFAEKGVGPGNCVPSCSFSSRSVFLRSYIAAADVVDTTFAVLAGAGAARRDWIKVAPRASFARALQQGGLPMSRRVFERRPPSQIVQGAVARQSPPLRSGAGHRDLCRRRPPRAPRKRRRKGALPALRVGRLRLARPSACTGSTRRRELGRGRSGRDPAHHFHSNVDGPRTGDAGHRLYQGPGSQALGRQADAGVQRRGG